MLVADKLVGTVAGLARLAVQKGVGKACDVTCGYPRLRIHDYCRVKTDVVRALLNEFFEPRLLDVVFELHPERSVIPGVGKASVYLAARVDIASRLAEVYDHIKCFFAVFHLLLLHSRGRLPRNYIIGQSPNFLIILNMSFNVNLSFFSFSHIVVGFTMMQLEIKPVIYIEFRSSAH